MPSIAEYRLGWIGFAIVALAGCSVGPYLPKDTQRNTLETYEPFVLLDKATQRVVTCTVVDSRVRADGRLEVSANVKNRRAQRVEVLVRCVFKDARHVSTGDETPWQTLILAQNATETVSFVAMNPTARHFTISVRLNQ